MTSYPEFDPLHAPEDPPEIELPSQLGEDEEEPPQLEGMLFCSFLSADDLNGNSWDALPPMPELPPPTVWDEPAAPDAALLRAMAAARQLSRAPDLAPGERSSASEAFPPLPPLPPRYWIAPEAQIPSESHKDPFADQFGGGFSGQPAGRQTSHGRAASASAAPGLYGNLADTSWLQAERTRQAGEELAPAVVEPTAPEVPVAYQAVAETVLTEAVVTETTAIEPAVDERVTEAQATSGSSEPQVGDAGIGDDAEPVMEEAESPVEIAVPASVETPASLQADASNAEPERATETESFAEEELVAEASPVVEIESTAEADDEPVVEPSPEPEQAVEDAAASEPEPNPEAESSALEPEEQLHAHAEAVPETGHDVVEGHEAVVEPSPDTEPDAAAELTAGTAGSEAGPKTTTEPATEPVQAAEPVLAFAPAAAKLAVVEAPIAALAQEARLQEKPAEGTPAAVANGVLARKLSVHEAIADELGAACEQASDVGADEEQLVEEAVAAQAEELNAAVPDEDQQAVPVVEAVTGEALATQEPARAETPELAPGAVAEPTLEPTSEPAPELMLAAAVAPLILPAPARLEEGLVEIVAFRNPATMAALATAAAALPLHNDAPHTEVQPAVPSTTGIHQPLFQSFYPERTSRQVMPVAPAPPAQPTERPLFHSFYPQNASRALAPQPTSRTPHLGHLALLAALAVLGLYSSSLLMRSAIYFHLWGVSRMQDALTDVHYTIAGMAALYLITFSAALLIYPLLWRKSLFAGLQWNGMGAVRRVGPLIGAAFVCFVLALVDQVLLPGPTDAPIDKLFDSRTAAWLLLIFGITFAPFFEEIIFRGFLLPALCTAFDWCVEGVTSSEPRPLGEDGHPIWSRPAMVLGAIGTSVPFAYMHAEQTGYSLGPFLLLVVVSLVLCWARLSTRSLAASVIVHASYNLMLFSLMLAGTGGFTHLDKM